MILMETLSLCSLISGTRKPFLPPDGVVSVTTPRLSSTVGFQLPVKTLKPHFETGSPEMHAYLLQPKCRAVSLSFRSLGCTDNHEAEVRHWLFALTDVQQILYQQYALDVAPIHVTAPSRVWGCFSCQPPLPHTLSSNSLTDCCL